MIAEKPCDSGRPLTFPDGIVSAFVVAGNPCSRLFKRLFEPCAGIRTRQEPAESSVAGGAGLNKSVLTQGDYSPAPAGATSAARKSCTPVRKGPEKSFDGPSPRLRAFRFTLANGKSPAD
jgi:hypothetical protein